MEIALVVVALVIVGLLWVVMVDRRHKKDQMNSLLGSGGQSIVDECNQLTQQGSALFAEYMAGPQGEAEFQTFQTAHAPILQRLNQLQILAQDEARANGIPVTAANPALAASGQSTFDVTQKYLGLDGLTGVAIDRINRRIALLTPYSREIVDYSQIVSSEVCVDAKTMIKTDRGQQILGAALGGIFAGGVGALVLAMGASKTSVQSIERVELKILTAGTSRHQHVVTFCERGGWKSPEIAIKEAEEWHDLLSVAMREAQPSSAPVSPLPTPTRSLAEEIRELANLRSQGLLSDTEFSSAKTRLLGDPDVSRT